MRKFFILMILLIFSISFSLSCHAHIYVKEGNEINPNIGTATLYYTFHVSEKQNLTYDLKLDGNELKSGKSSLENTIFEDNVLYYEFKTPVVLDVSSMVAGEHKATSFYKTDLCSVDSNYTFKILPRFNLELINPVSVVYLYDDSTKVVFEIENKGNSFVELLPEIDVPENKVTFEWPIGLEIGRIGRITITLTKPIDNGLYTLLIKARYKDGDYINVIKHPIEIINPVFNLTIDNYNTTLNENSTNVKIKLKNSGNLPLDLFFHFKIADLTGGSEEIFTGSIGKKETKEFNFTFPIGKKDYLKERVTGLAVKYKLGNKTNSLEPVTLKSNVEFLPTTAGKTLSEKAKRNKVAIISLLILLGIVILLVAKKKWK